MLNCVTGGKELAAPNGMTDDEKLRTRVESLERINDSLIAYLDAFMYEFKAVRQVVYDYLDSKSK
jgi:hypothetical protein